jgi:hypothetical protein
MFHDEIGVWEQHAYDPSDLPVEGKRTREWTAVGPTEEACVAEMARCCETSTRVAGRGDARRLTPILTPSRMDSGGHGRTIWPPAHARVSPVSVAGPVFESEDREFDPSGRAM